jgi:hypothetical protein
MKGNMGDGHEILAASGKGDSETESGFLQQERISAEEKKRKELALRKALEVQRFLDSLADQRKYAEIKNVIDCRVKILHYEVIAGEGPGWLPLSEYLELRDKAYKLSTTHSLENPVTQAILDSAQRSIDMAVRVVTEDMTGMFR